MKIAHLTSVHFRDDPRIFEKQCVSLSKAGYDVNLVVADGRGNGSKDNVSIHDVGTPSNRIDQFSRIQWRVFRQALRINASLYHLHDPELIPVGIALKKAGKTVIFDAHEMVAKQLLYKAYLPAFARRSISRSYRSVEKFASKRIDAVIVPQELMVPLYSQFAKTVVVENFAHVPPSLGKSAPRIEDGIKIFHAGSLNISRGLLNMINLSEVLSDGNSIVLAGKVDDYDKSVFDKLKSSKVNYVGILKLDAVSKEYANCNVGIILYNNVDQYYLSNAVKLFEYMSRGIPVLMPDFGEWVAFNEHAKCGINVDVQDAEGIKYQLDKWKKDPSLAYELGQNGLRAFHERYHWSVAEAKLLQLYKELLN